MPLEKLSKVNLVEESIILGSTSSEKGQGHVPVAMRITTVTCLPCPSPLLLLLVQLLLRLLLSGPEFVGAASPCPTHCSCSNQASRVICTRQSLDGVPESISVNTRYLNLQENSIEVNMDCIEHYPLCSFVLFDCLCVCVRACPCMSVCVCVYCMLVIIM